MDGEDAAAVEEVQPELDGAVVQQQPTERGGSSRPLKGAWDQQTDDPVGAHQPVRQLEEVPVELRVPGSLVGVSQDLRRIA